jgi:hypothetical protein
MPTYVVSAPDGKEYEVDAPEGATQDQALAYFQQNWQQPMEQPQQAQQPAAPTYDPTEGMSGVDKFLAGTGKAFTDIGRGVGQLTGLMSQEEIDAARKLDEPLMKTGAGIAGNVVGNVAALAPTMFIPGANTVAGGAALGGLSSALMPTATGESRASNALIGTVAGGAIPAVMRGGKILKAALRPFSEKGQKQIVGDVLKQAAQLEGNQLDDWLNAIRQNPEMVAGSKRTLAQMADVPGISALERGAQQNLAMTTPLTNRYVEQNLARIGALQDIAGDPATLARMIGDRSQAVESLYDAANQAKVPATKELLGLLERPAVKSAYSTAIENLQNAGIPEPEGVVSGRTLGEKKKALSAMQSGTAMTGAEKAAQRGISAATGDFGAFLQNQLPQYKQADALFSELSKPINQRMIGQELLNRVEPALSRGTGTEVNRKALAKAVIDNGDDIARQVTGFKGAKLKDIMTGDQMATIKNVIDDFAAAERSMKSGRGAGSNTFQNLSADQLLKATGLPSPILDAAGSIPFISPTVRAGANILGRAAYGGTDEALQSRLLDALLNPEIAAESVQMAAPKIPASYRGVRLPQTPNLLQLLTMGGGLNAAQQ